MKHALTTVCLILMIAGLLLSYNSVTAQQKIRVLYVGDTGVILGPNIIASPFYYETKGYQVSVWCQPVLDALNASGDITVEHMANWDALAKFPETTEDIAAKYDVVVLSDCEQEVLVLYPFERFMNVPMGANRLVSIREFVRKGGGLVMIGGWESFTGRRGIGNWGGTPVEEALPVKCLEVNDDRHECPEGVHIETLVPDHPILAGIRWETCPMFTGYQRIIAKPDAQVLARVKEFGDPFCIVSTFGKGRSMAFASDIAPHWGSGFQRWDNYGKFFIQSVRWLAGKETTR